MKHFLITFIDDDGWKKNIKWFCETIEEASAVRDQVLSVELLEETEIWDIEYKYNDKKYIRAGCERAATAKEAIEKFKKNFTDIEVLSIKKRLKGEI